MAVYEYKDRNVEDCVKSGLEDKIEWKFREKKKAMSNYKIKISL